MRGSLTLLTGLPNSFALTSRHSLPPPLIYLSVSVSAARFLSLCARAHTFVYRQGREVGTPISIRLEMKGAFAATDALDHVVVTLIGVGGVAMLIGNIVILCNRSYIPIKTKSVLLTLLSSLGGLIWIVAALVVNHHFKRKNNSFLAICALWTFWLQGCFGFALWLNCLTLRLITLYRIFICKRDTRIYYPFLILLLSPAVAICIAGSITSELKYIESSPGKGNDGDCRFEEKAFLAYGLIALLVIYFLIFLGFAFKLRNAMAQYNEFRLIRRGGILSLFLFLLSLVTLKTRAYDKSVGRSLLSAAVASTIFYYFWARNGIVVYNVLFNRVEYLEKFHKDLKRSLSQHEREKSSAGFLKMEAQLKEVRAELESHEVKIKELEDEVKELERDYASRQQRTSPHSSPKSHEIILKDSRTLHIVEVNYESRGPQVLSE